MNENYENINKTKTYLVIIFFIVIIFLSSYVVVDKILKRNENETNKNEEINKQNITNNSKIITELSLDNKLVENIYDITNDMDYILYLNKNKKLTWDTKSYITGKKLINNSNNYDIFSVDSETFNKKYEDIFGINPVNIKSENKISQLCGGASYNDIDYSYTFKLDCEDNTNMKTYLKNITIEDLNIKINKYYVFISNNENENKFDLYRDADFNKNNLIKSNVDNQNINEYIKNMNVISYIFKKGNDGNYYLDSIA